MDNISVSDSGSGHVRSSRIITQEEQFALFKGQLEHQVAQLTQQNQEAVTSLEKQGIGFNDMGMVRTRINVLIASIANAFGPQGELWQLQAELEWQQAVAAEVAKAREVAPTANLALGGQFTPEMIRQLARETGFFRGGL